jgi:hypothetical protein
MEFVFNPLQNIIMFTPSSFVLNLIRKGSTFFSALLIAIGAYASGVLPKSSNMPLAEVGPVTYKKSSMPPKVQNFNREIAKQEAAKKLAMAKAAQDQKKLTSAQQEAAKKAKAAQNQAARLQRVSDQNKSKP